MLELIWPPAALRDVQRCYRFLVPKSPDAASRAVRAIREGIASSPRTLKLGVRRLRWTRSSANG